MRINLNENKNKSKLPKYDSEKFYFVTLEQLKYYFVINKKFYLDYFLKKINAILVLLGVREYSISSLEKTLKEIRETWGLTIIPHRKSKKHNFYCEYSTVGLKAPENGDLDTMLITKLTTAKQNYGLRKIRERDKLKELYLEEYQSYLLSLSKKNFPKKNGKFCKTNDFITKHIIRFINNLKKGKEIGIVQEIYFAMKCSNYFKSVGRP